MELSIIIPVLNEAGVLDRTLLSLAHLPHEIIVVDGGSRDESVAIAMRYGTRLLTSGRGRGIQMDTGALKASGDTLLFLHADTLLPGGFENFIRRTLERPEVALGAFRLGFQPGNARLRLIAHGADLRSRLWKLPYGDQALFMRRQDYFRAGGFKPLPIMEDVDLVRRLRMLGAFRLAKERVRTSPRRWEKEGFLHVTLRNWSLILGYFLGVSPRRLRRHYSDCR
jgi:rSAM/selenodomain-associated transferase 2